MLPEHWIGGHFALLSGSHTTAGNDIMLEYVIQVQMCYSGSQLVVMKLC